MIEGPVSLIGRPGAIADPRHPGDVEELFVAACCGMTTTKRKSRSGWAETRGDGSLSFAVEQGWDLVGVGLRETLEQAIAERATGVLMGLDGFAHLLDGIESARKLAARAGMDEQHELDHVVDILWRALGQAVRRRTTGVSLSLREIELVAAGIEAAQAVATDALAAIRAPAL